jgi:hypothetical protein
MTIRNHNIWVKDLSCRGKNCLNQDLQNFRICRMDFVSRRDEICITVGEAKRNLRHKRHIYRLKSRRDGTLLTVGFSLRRSTAPSPIVPQGRHNQVSPLRGEERGEGIPIRRLKPTVNKVLSLRDIDTCKSDICVYWGGLRARHPLAIMPHFKE